MTKKAFNKIAGGLTEAMAVVREEAQPTRLHVPIRTAPLAIVLRWLACPHMSAAEMHRVVRGMRTLRAEMIGRDQTGDNVTEKAASRAYPSRPNCIFVGPITADPVLMAEANSWR